MALTTCRECNARVSAEAPTCPQCGVPQPALGSPERDAAGQREGRIVNIGCGALVAVTVLALLAGALYNEFFKVELDDAAVRACEGVTTARFGDEPVRRAAGQLTAVQSARETSVEGLREAVGPGPLDPDSVSDHYRSVAAWCDENQD